MKDCFNGLVAVNVELTSRCNKNCWMCGRRKIEMNYPDLVDWGDMKIELVKSIAKQLPSGIIVHLHNNGEPTLYPKLSYTLDLFKNQIRQFDTNGKLIVEKADEIIDRLETLTISVIQDDPEGKEQYEIVKQFIDIKGDRKPNIVYRCLGFVDTEKWEKLPGIVVSRLIHSPMGSYKYRKPPTIPEHGICLDLLSHLAIDRYGKVSPCVRFDPRRIGIIGDITKESLIDIWNGEKRKKWLKAHINQNRKDISLCSKCEYYGVPTGN